MSTKDRKKSVLGMSGMGTAESVRVSEIIFNEENNVRETYENLEGLAETIKREGLIQPVVLDYSGNLIAGFRRFKAITEILKWKEIPAIRKAVTKENRILIQLLENVQREDLTDYEYAVNLKKLKESENASDEELGKMIGKSKKWVNDKLTHFKIAAKIKEARTLPTSSVMETRGLDEKSQKAVLDKAEKNSLPVKKIRDEVEKEKSRRRDFADVKIKTKDQQHSNKARIKELKTEIRDLEKRLNSAKAELSRLEKI